MVEEQRPHIQASTSSKNLICSTIMRIGDSEQEVLLDSGSSISSINEALVQALHLPVQPASTIKVLFGDNKNLYTSSTQALCTLSFAQHSLTHAFYVLPRQLFPITVGCDWFIKTGAQLHFDSQQLILPSTNPIPLFINRTRTCTPINSQHRIVSPEERQHDIRSLLQAFPSLFQPSAQTAKVNCPTRHIIPTGDAPPVYMAHRRRSPLEQERINKAVREMLGQGIIRHSSSEWVSEPHLVRKDDGSYRFCVDFRPLNKITVHDKYPLPRIDDLFD